MRSETAQAAIDARVALEVADMVTSVPEWGDESYVEGPFHIAPGPERDALIQQRIEKELEEERRHSVDYAVHTWRSQPLSLYPDGARNSDESCLVVMKPLHHGGAYCALGKCDDPRITALLLGKQRDA
jgi:hypothetical protein